MQKKRILFTGGGGAGNEAIWELLKGKYSLYFADCDIGNIDPVIPSDRKLSIPMAGDDDFIDKIDELCKKTSIDFLVPSVDEELLKISERKDAISGIVLAPKHDFIASMLDKNACVKKILEKGLDAPKTYLVTQWQNLNFPLIIKPQTGRGSRGVQVINSKQELDAYMVFNKNNENNLIVQEYALGAEYTVFVSANEQEKLNCVIPVKVKEKKGVTITAEIDMNETVLEYVRQFHSLFKTSGIYNLQCILTECGRVLPFEINPRVSTTFCMSLAAGFDPFENFLKASDEIFSVDRIVSLRRHWRNYISLA